MALIKSNHFEHLVIPGSSNSIGIFFLWFAMASSLSTSNFAPIKTISLKSHPEISEAWVQQVLFENPTLLGLGSSVNSRDKERRQIVGGRLDLLLEDEDSEVRYEVEIQLGPTDETHIIRTIEYWDIERKRYPGYDHVAVIVAEEITSRFFNVISLFNSTIPLMAFKMTAIENSDGSISLLFTKVLDLAPSPQLEDDEPSEQTDRSYWEKQSSKKVLQDIDHVLELIQRFEPKAQLSYNKFYLGIWVNGRANNFVVFRPRKNYFILDVKLERNDDNDELIRTTGCDEIKYHLREQRYRFYVGEKIKSDVEQSVVDVLKKAYLS